MLPQSPKISARDTELFELIEATDMMFIQLRSLAIGVQLLLHSGRVRDALAIVSIATDRMDEGSVFLNDARTLMAGGCHA
ncbi:hypothetical protein [Pararobbsia silviterrae]|uniref:hypothetical protein n=1 Tax=Pararobbsia silviterrae TaxID=1792498 RepID=UPI0011C3BE90|nr:hypothetical protein [Pararobbsia silviterrae]